MAIKHDFEPPCLVQLKLKPYASKYKQSLQVVLLRKCEKKEVHFGSSNYYEGFVIADAFKTRISKTQQLFVESFDYDLVRSLEGPELTALILQSLAG